MALTLRKRSLPPEVHEGALSVDGSNSTSSVVTRSGDCWDYTGDPYGVKPLSKITVRQFTPMLINGSRGDPEQTGYREWTDYPTTYPGNPGGSGEPAFPTTGWENNSSFAAQVAASTNPSRAHVSVPTFVGELRELPQLLRQTGNLLNKLGRRTGQAFTGRNGFTARDIANANLAYQFGWKPLISDLKKLLQFEEAISKRVDELNRLSSGKGLRRKRTQGPVTEETHYGESTFHSHLVSIRGIQDSTRTMTRWAVVNWRPNTSNLPPTGSPEMRKIARRYVFGMDSSQQIQTVWNLLPWSWLIDWFANIDDTLQATNNSLAYAGPTCVMNHTNNTKQYIVTSTSPDLDGDCSNGTFKVDRKTRTVHYGYLTASLPILSNRQLSILGSLAITKSRIRF